MPKTRLSKGLWRAKRLLVLERAGFCCVHCGCKVAVDTGHVDHIRSGKLGDNAMKNLRTLCRRCHVLRADNRHRGMIAHALRDGIIPPNWRELVWEDDD